MAKISTSGALRGAKLLVAGCAATVALGGCGSAATTDTSPGTTAQLAPNATPSQILQASLTALASAHSYRMQGTMTELTKPRARMHLSVSVYSERQVLMSVSGATGRWTVILDGKRAYMAASRRFWLLHSHGNAVVAKVFANRWILALPATARKLAASLRGVASPTAARCMLQHGTLSNAGTTIVGQQDAVVLRDAGNVPGGQPGTLAVAMIGTPYPLRLSASGTPRPGGPKKGPCASSGPPSVGSVTLSDFDQLGALPVPAHAINLQALEHHKPQTAGAAI